MVQLTCTARARPPRAASAWPEKGWLARRYGTDVAVEWNETTQVAGIVFRGSSSSIDWVQVRAARLQPLHAAAWQPRLSLEAAAAKGTQGPAAVLPWPQLPSQAGAECCMLV